MSCNVTIAIPSAIEAKINLLVTFEFLFSRMEIKNIPINKVMEIENKKSIF